VRKVGKILAYGLISAIWPNKSKFEHVGKWEICANGENVVI
jgi:hypothetical protein